MTYLLIVLSTLTLLVGFIVLVRYEKQYSRRIFAEKRAAFDTHIERIEFVIEHVDLAAFAKEEINHAMNQVGHAATHVSLQVVRAVERFLTRHVRSLRARQEDSTLPRESTREFVKTLSDFKDTLQATHPEISVSDAGIPEVGFKVE